MIKKLLAITLVLAFILSMVGCGEIKEIIEDDPSKLLAPIQKELNQLTSDLADEDYIASKFNQDAIKNFEDIANAITENFDVKTELDDDGNLKVELNLPTVGDEKDKTAIPTIDKPVPEENEEPEAPVENEEKEAEKEPTPEVEEEPEEPQKEEVIPKKEEKEEENVETPEPTVPKKEFYTYTTNQTHTALPITERYLYSLLDKEQQEAYLDIDKAVKNVEESVSLNFDPSKDRKYYIYYIYMFDNPDVFYLSNTVTIYRKSDAAGTLKFSYSVGKNEGEYCGYGRDLTPELKQKIKEKKAVFDAEVNRIISTIPANAPDVEKEKLIYDRILLDSFYNLSAQWDGLANDNWTAYGILVNKYGVCESYSEAFQTLCLAVGIKCTGVVGDAGGGHKWNAVELDGEWYMCDITFDDPIGGDPDRAYHSYFNLTAQKMTELNHDWSDCDMSVPQCDGTKYSFQNYFK